VPVACAGCKIVVGAVMIMTLGEQRQYPGWSWKYNIVGSFCLVAATFFQSIFLY
jgi:hypothetical protein